MHYKNSYDVKLNPRLVPQDALRPTFAVDDSGNLTITSGDWMSTLSREEAMKLAGFIDRYCKATPSFFFNWPTKTSSCYAVEA